MTSKYAAYTVYGKDKGRLVLGCSKALDNKQRYLHGEVIEDAFTKCKAYNFIVIDWKRYKVKYHLNGIESIGALLSQTNFGVCLGSPLHVKIGKFKLTGI